jgi:hypothetical protein
MTGVMMMEYIVTQAGLKREVIADVVMPSGELRDIAKETIEDVLAALCIA